MADVGLTGFAGITAQSQRSGNSGAISIVADTFDVRDGASIINSSFGTGSAGDIQIETDDFILDRAAVNSGTLFGTSAGSISITAQEFEINGGTVSTTTFSDTVPEGGLSFGGDISVVTEDLSIIDGGRIISQTIGLNNAGAIDIQTNSLTIEGDGVNPTGIQSNASSRLITFIETGNGGPITITADTVDILRGGTIESSTFSNGDAGPINIETDSLRIDGTGVPLADNGQAFVNTGINSNAGLRSTGNAGEITINAGDMQLVSRGNVTSSTFGEGNAGSITIDAGNFGITGVGDERDPTGIFTESLFGVTGNSGSAGEIMITADSITIADTGAISSSTQTNGDAGSIELAADDIEIRSGGALRSISNFTGLGNGGTITITADSITLSGEDAPLNPRVLPDVAEPLQTAIATNADRIDGPAVAGNIIIDADSFEVLDGAIISSQSFGDGTAGSIAISANDIALSGNSTISTSNAGSGLGGDVTVTATGLATFDGSSLTTSTAAGDGGRITLSGGAVDLRDSQITTSVGGAAGDGGDITITNAVLVQDNSVIQANAFGGDGGNITITGDLLIQHPGRVATIEATSTLGISGDINVSTPETDAVGGLVALTGDFLEESALLGDTCNERIGGAPTNSLLPVGRGGLPPSPTDPGSGLYFVEALPPNTGATAPQPLENITSLDLDGQSVHLPRATLNGFTYIGCGR